MKNSVDINDPDTLVKAAKLFGNIAKAWDLNDEQILKILPVELEGRERLLAISAVLGIYKSLHLIFANKQQANSWVHRVNTHYEGMSALEFMFKNGVEY